ncbi:hypothetical protein Hypma_001976 [Hypsizygus marmoreus]|uniref:Uncharacterized protein n=1 Tax=Hypsizygus marmoreus TaxID=39966 RepID=A0A369JEG5_HYPMA|nr:hypothetical protein Hypma_001976 [Hypsizygus marmoreus]
MESAANNFSYSAGGIALTGTTFSTVLWVRSRLPETRMKKLDDVFNHTIQTYHKSDAEGLLPNDFKVQIELQLTRLDRLKEAARERTYRAATLFEQIKASLQGLSGQIMRIEDKTKEVRAQVVTKSEEGRRSRGVRQDGIASPTNPQLFRLVSADGPMTETTMPSTVYSQPFSSQTTLVESTAQAASTQPCSQLTVEDTSQTSTPQLRWFAAATTWSRLMKWRSSSIQPPDDIESGIQDMVVST